ncbi:MAG: prepilin-type N-terminal cleavage/methylation domain-containing protein [Actinomycetota bacterium]|nr:prepilin-type N-terminal cleavage/methylation domain-containing protein [Actinomycetota bacterium]
MIANEGLPESDTDDGFTLVELLVSMTVVFVLLAVTMSGVLAAGSAVKTTSQQQSLNEEARQAINRMARDLRQAKSVVTAVNPDGPSFNNANIVAVRAQADFDGDGCIGGAGGAAGVTCLAYNPGNPEDVTYCYEPGTKQLYVIDNQAAGVTPVTAASISCAGGQPLLAGNVSAFKVEYRSNQYRYDLDPTDGITTWRELDEAPPPVGNGNGLLDIELAEVDSVVLNVTMAVGGHTQAYRTQVDLRNQS